MPSWSALELNHADPTKPPAGSFPDRADIYACDNCGTDITKFLRRRSAHAWPPYGPEQYVCSCGKTYLTGVREWAFLDPKERQRRLRYLFWLALFLVVMLSVPSTILGFLTYRFSASIRVGVAVGVIVATSFSVWMLTSEVGGIIRSIMRTKAESLKGGAG
jgi:hypothetical protein